MRRPSQKTQPRTRVRQWREYRNLTQEALAERVGVSHGTISRLENGRIAYTQRLLEAIADALRCTPADLLMRDPTDPEAIWSIWDNLTPPLRRQAVALLSALKNTGTHG